MPIIDAPGKDRTKKPKCASQRTLAAFHDRPTPWPELFVSYGLSGYDACFEQLHVHPRNRSGLELSQQRLDMRVNAGSIR
jgi:hypothetical protein